MKLITYCRNEAVRCGILTQAGVIDIASAWQHGSPPASVIEILQRGPACLKELIQITDNPETLLPLESVRLLAPIPNPPKIIALAGNYGEHIKEASLKCGFSLGLSDSPAKTTVPRLFLMPSTVIIGPDEKIPWPAYSEQIDYEIELAVVIGKRCKAVPPEIALDFVAGYTIVNDVSARSVTFKAGRTARPWDEFYDWFAGKWADGFLPTGPFLLTADEIPDPQNLDMQLTVNGQIRQKANTSQMIFTVAETISFLSHIMTLLPGDIIATGTPAGVAVATGRFLQAGDRIECTIEKLGTLTNTLGSRPEKFYRPLISNSVK